PSAIECIPVARQLSATRVAQAYAAAAALGNRPAHAPAARTAQTTCNEGKAAAIESWARSSRSNLPNQPCATKGRGGATSGNRKYSGKIAAIASSARRRNFRVARRVYVGEESDGPCGSGLGESAEVWADGLM